MMSALTCNRFEDLACLLNDLRGTTTPIAVAPTLATKWPAVGRANNRSA